MQDANQELLDSCHKAIERYSSGDISLTDVAAKICSVANYNFKGRVHPMLYYITSYAFDISENYRTEAEDKEDWSALTKTLECYEAGKWYPTCWSLSAMYGVRKNGKISHSFSVSVTRINGATEIVAPIAELKAAISKVITKINTQQTDELYLRNLGMLVPLRVGEYEQMSTEIAEHINTPYVSA